MLTIPTPGFGDRVHDAQQTFRTLLDALAQPGQVRTLTAAITPPQGLTPACAAACLTLLDLETQVWLQPGLHESVTSWLLFHTGCRLTPYPQASNFAVIWDLTRLPDLDAFNWGTAECPETSTTVLIQTEQLSQGIPIVLKGPGILQECAIAPQLPEQFWRQWQRNCQSYPLGIDVFLFAQHRVMGLPRTAKPNTTEI
jgi:alpha-D-ribose 1-methylphosphonate 5-triphosphate synthase subunit PhnH